MGNLRMKRPNLTTMQTKEPQRQTFLEKVKSLGQAEWQRTVLDQVSTVAVTG